LSLELGQFGITSNNVLPGYTETARLDAVLDMRSKSQDKSREEVAKELQSSIPIRRFSEAREVAAAVAFLCSPAAGSISGVSLAVDGGGRRVCSD
jgi:3-oxoacyl-[acyl-carrier protein] reductase